MCLVEVCQVAKRFGSLWALRDLSFGLDSGEILGAVGANGGGKTTCLRILAGLLQPDLGQARFAGRPASDRSARSGLGYLTQTDSLYANLTVAENLLARSRLHGLCAQRAREAINEGGLAEVAQRRVAHLSGGWKRRAQFAATTIHRPRLLLLDEPTAGLDGQAREALWRSILRLAREGVAIVISTHDLEEAGLCGRLGVFRPGVPAQLTTPETLIQETTVEVVALPTSTPSSELVRLLEACPQAGQIRPGGGRLRLILQPTRVAQFRQAASEMGVNLVDESPTLTDVLAFLGSQI